MYCVLSIVSKICVSKKYPKYPRKYIGFSGLNFGYFWILDTVFRSFGYFWIRFGCFAYVLNTFWIRPNFEYVLDIFGYGDLNFGYFWIRKFWILDTVFEFWIRRFLILDTAECIQINSITQTLHVIVDVNANTNAHAKANTNV